jgi:hypothetical protein
MLIVNQIIVYSETNNLPFYQIRLKLILVLKQFTTLGYSSIFV